MQLLNVTPSSSGLGSQGVADRFRAAATLVFLPDSIYGIVERGAAAADAAGRRVTAADLLRPYLNQVSVDGTRSALLDAVTGALRVAPEFDPNRRTLIDAANGVADLITRSVADRTAGSGWIIASRITDQLDAIAAPIYDVAFRLDPSNG